MPSSLRLAILITDIAFLAYWMVGLASLAGLFTLPASLMYADYGNPIVFAWNWSFLPLDLAFSVAGLLAVAAARRGDSRWRGLALLSLSFTMAAGGMAVSLWAIRGEFDPAWFLPNLAIALWPLCFLPQLLSNPTATPA
jgi:hypothetical protein